MSVESTKLHGIRSYLQLAIDGLREQGEVWQYEYYLLEDVLAYIDERLDEIAYKE